jgi:hypothetical protein
MTLAMSEISPAFTKWLGDLVSYRGNRIQPWRKSYFMSSFALLICLARAAVALAVTESSITSRSVDAFWYRLYRFQLPFPLRFGLSTIWIKTLFSSANLLKFFASSVSFISARDAALAQRAQAAAAAQGLCPVGGAASARGGASGVLWVTQERPLPRSALSTTGSRRSGLRGCCGSNFVALRSASSASQVRGPTLPA